MKNARHSNLVYRGWNDEPPGLKWRTAGAEMTNFGNVYITFFFYLSYDILVCSNVFYNIFYICNEVLMRY